MMSAPSAMCVVTGLGTHVQRLLPTFAADGVLWIALACRLYWIYVELLWLMGSLDLNDCA